MKLNRTQWILAAVLVLQIALSVFAFWPRGGAAGSGEPLLPGLTDAQVVAITVTDAEANSITLRKVTGEWVLPSADDYPANAEQIDPLLETIAGLTTRRLVTRTAASHKRLQVAADDFLRRVELETADGTVHTLYIGSSPSYGTSHVRVEGKDETYLVSDISQWDFGVNPVPWVSSTYFSLSQDDVKQVVLTNAQGTFTFDRGEDGSWTLAGLAAEQELDTTEVNSVITKVTQVTMSRPLGKERVPEYGMDDPLAVVTLHKEAETITMSVGAQDPADNTYVVNVSTSPYYVRVSDYNIRPLVENARSDFITPPATPTPTAEAS
jgi:hypothetical protein